jgi:hypothetical protein
MVAAPRVVPELFARGVAAVLAEGRLATPGLLSSAMANAVPVAVARQRRSAPSARARST